MENLDFSEEEIHEQLAALGYGNVTKGRLREFKRDLDLLIHHEKSKSNTSAEWSSPKSHGTSCKSPPAFTKEKVQIPSATSRYNYVYCGNSPADLHRQVLISTFNDENCDHLNLRPTDSYIRHSVAPRCIRPSAVPNRLEVYEESSDIYPSVLGASEPLSPQRDLQTTTKPALKRKVLRKRRGHSRVCDESTHSEDSEFSNPRMYKACYSYSENAYEEDNASLSSSFWTDQEDSEERYVEDDRIETGLGICKQEMNKEEEQHAEGDSKTGQTGGKTIDPMNEDDAQYYAREQNTDENSACESEVNQHGYCSAESPGKENENEKQKPGTEDQKRENYIKKGCATEKTSDWEHDMMENSHAEFRKAGYEAVKRREKDDNAENKREVQSNCFVNDENVNMSLDEESESDDLESDEEIEHFASVLSQGVTKDDESKGKNVGRDMIFGNQDDMSKPLMNDEQACAGGGQMYKVKKYPESRIYFMAEQHSDNFALVNVDRTEEADQMYTEHRDDNRSAEQIWKHGSDPLEAGVNNEDFHGSVSSLSASIVTSGYGTYKPDSSKDDLDGRDDWSLFELELETEYPNDHCAQDDPNLSWYRGWLSPDVAQQQITSASLNSGDLNPFDSGDRAAYNTTDTVQGTHENRPGSAIRNAEDSRTFSLSAESINLSAKEEKGIRTNSPNSAFCSKDQEDTTFRNNDERPNECKTTFKDQWSEDGSAKKTKKKHKSQHFRLSELEEQLAHLHVSFPHKQHELYSESEQTSSYSDRCSSAPEELPSAFQVYLKGRTRSHSENDFSPHLKSFIRPVMGHPGTRNFKKTDPVAKYFQYKQDWEMFKPPGDKRRNELHWAIREQLAYHPPPPRPQRTYIPNTYVVPTAKKRSALRWEIRHDLANGIIPARGTYT